MSFWTAVVAIAGIAALVLMNHAKYRAIGGRRDVAPEPPPRVGELEREVAELKKRLAVLERIATDDRHGRAVAAEIEALRDR
ncbi:MAG: hypothetical protein ABW203_03015 [Novosphingobium sp.]